MPQPPFAAAAEPPPPPVPPVPPGEPRPRAVPADFELEFHLRTMSTVHRQFAIGRVPRRWTFECGLESRHVRALGRAFAPCEMTELVARELRRILNGRTDEDRDARAC